MTETATTSASPSLSPSLHEALRRVFSLSPTPGRGAAPHTLAASASLAAHAERDSESVSVCVCAERENERDAREDALFLRSVLRRIASSPSPSSPLPQRETEREGEEQQSLSLSLSHLDRLRLVFLCLRRFGRRDALPLLFRAASSSESETLTYFWIQVVHHAMAVEEARNMPPHTHTAHAHAHTETGTGTETVSGSLSLSFRALLQRHPQLLDEHALPREFFSERALRDALSSAEVCLPDRKALPSLVGVSLTHTHTHSDSDGDEVPVMSDTTQTTQQTHFLSDCAFLQLATQRALPSWGHAVRLRLLYAALLAHGRRRGGADRALAVLEGVEGRGFEVTRGYFWLQMLTFHMQRVFTLRVRCVVAAGGTAGAVDDLFGALTNDAVCSEENTQDPLFAESMFSKAMSFEEFSAQPGVDELFDPFLIDKYYSRQCEEEMRGPEMVLPTLKPLPNLVHVH